MAKIHRALLGASLSAIVLFLSVGIAVAGTQPPSCTPSDACVGNTGPTAPGSCNGDASCRNNSASIGKGSCDDHAACQENSGSVGPDSCNGDGACESNSASIGKMSCNGASACVSNAASVGPDSCNGHFACDNNTAPIGKDSCNGLGACCGNSTPIGSAQCNGDGECAPFFNHAPSFTPVSDVTVPENSPPTQITFTNISAGPPDESRQKLTFSITGNTNPGLVTPFISGDQLTLTYTPGMNGTAQITVRLMDDGGTSCGGQDFSEDRFTVTVM